MRFSLRTTLGALAAGFFLALFALGTITNDQARDIAAGNAAGVTILNAFTPTAATIGTLTVSTGSTFPAGDIIAADIATIVESIYWTATDLSADGTQCNDAVQESTIAGPELYVITCADNDAGLIGGSAVMPDSWDGGTVTFEVTMVQTAAETLLVHGDMEVQCRGNGETIVDTWSSEVALDVTQAGASAVDQATSAAITPAGTCAGGDLLVWQYSVDATGTTATVATNNFLGFKMEYTSNVGD